MTWAVRLVACLCAMGSLYIVALAGAAPPPTNLLPNPEHVPEFTLTPAPQYSDKLLRVRGHVSRQRLEITTVEVIRGIPPNRPAEPDELTVELIDPNSQTIRSFGVNDPRVVHVIEQGGETFVQEEAPLDIVVPYYPGATGLRIRPGRLEAPPSFELQARGMTIDSLRLPPSAAITVNLRPAFERFCAAQPSDAECQAVLERKPGTRPPVPLKVE